MTKLEKTMTGALSSTEANVRTAIERVRDGAETRLRGFVRLLDRHPAASLATAFASGFLVARLLRKLD